MNYIILLIMILTSAAHTKVSTCVKLQPGKYIALFDKQFQDRYETFQIIIGDTTASRKVGYLTDVYKIQKVSECNYRFTLPQNADTSESTTLAKQFASVGQPYFDVYQINSDTLHFVYRINLHIMISSGKFILNNR